MFEQHRKLRCHWVPEKKKKVFFFVFFFSGDTGLYRYLKSKIGEDSDRGSTSDCERRNSIPTLKRLLNLKK